MNIVKSTNEINELIANNNNVVIDFFADWCGPCRTLTPKLEELSKQYEGAVTFAKFNVEDEEDDTLSNLSIRNIPVLLFYKNGEVVDRLTGGAAIPKLADKITEIYGPVA